MPRHIPQVGAPDPERETSPILDEEDAEELSFDVGLEAPACRFNGVPYEIGDYVLSGNELLHCVERGVWTRVGEMRPGEKDIGA
jgi:hypothetical protein